jgi:hypothetical protein
LQETLKLIHIDIRSILENIEKKTAPLQKESKPVLNEREFDSPSNPLRRKAHQISKTLSPDKKKYQADDEKEQQLAQFAKKMKYSTDKKK